MFPFQNAVYYRAKAMESQILPENLKRMLLPWILLIFN